MRVLGIDPGTYKMGVGVLDSEEEGPALVYSCVLIPRRSDPLSARLHYLYTQLLHLIHRWQPSVVAVEEPFVARNVRAAMAVGQAQAVAMMAAAHHGLNIYNYSPREVKKSVTGYGGSSKAQVQEMVGVLLGQPQPLASTDLADALAVAICHSTASRISQLTVRE